MQRFAILHLGLGIALVVEEFVACTDVITLFLDRNGLLVCVMPGNLEVDLKTAAKISGNKSVAMIHMKELLPETGYIRGGCSPVGMKKPLPTFIHESALLYDYIYVSAGVRGLQFKIKPEELIAFVGAGIYPL